MLKVLPESCRWSCDILKDNSESNSLFTSISISGISEVGSVKIYKSNSLRGRKYRQNSEISLRYCFVKEISISYHIVKILEVPIPTRMLVFFLQRKKKIMK